ncbi:FkbM family methyltransferase [Ruficoccus sp. ZRK36]|uniref:FkbM family methyltransferase n=1 Tax=Ruficoccus sp. ZRK36 TaxID=2866311 RepID=UPI001C734378|nr:FkbM family methyltransferase [Ruficoccus sp. ZRK36]QYY35085.1 FkbM family methyltransferase [Ruficoccus sp. ZRK36]
MSRLTESKFRNKIRENVARQVWKILMYLEHGQEAVIARNGESIFLRAWMERQHEQGNTPITVLDCGANRGDYTKALLKLADEFQGLDLNLYLFEPQQDLRETIRSNIPSLAEDHIVGAGVSSSKGTATLNRPATGSTHASLYQRSDNFTDHVEVPLVRLDDFLSERSIPHVDLLKLDVEGHEMEALKGLGEYCHPDKTSVIQFEYGATTLDANSNLKSLFDYLNGRGYEIAKIVKRGLSPRRYRPWLETFQFCNFVACHPDLLK